MSKITYRVVKHNGRWAYEANIASSKSFRTRDEARAAAKLAASERASEATECRTNPDSGPDRPTTVVNVE